MITYAQETLIMRITLCLAILIASFAGANAQESAFQKGPLISGYGPVAPIKSDLPIPEGTVMRVSFDIAKAADPGTVNRYIDSVARFLNMHAQAGMSLDQLNVAIVVHGGASNDLMNNEAYTARYGTQNASAPLLRALMNHNVEIILCGQSAAYYKVDKPVLESGVKMALSAMTAHALLQQSGYTLNPF